jgi:hypothetical protein
VNPVQKNSIKYTLEKYDHIQSLPTKYDAIFSQYSDDELFLSRSWFELFEETVVGDAGHVLVYGLVLASNPEVAVLLLPLWSKKSCNNKVKTLYSLGNYYSGIYEPLYAKSSVDLEEVFCALFNEIKRNNDWHVINLRSLVFGTPEYKAINKVLSTRKCLHQQYFMHGNWYILTENDEYSDIASSRPGVLRSTIKRKGKKFDQIKNASIEILIENQIDKFKIKDYWQVYSNSWKSDESHQNFINNLLKGGIKKRTVVLGLAYIDCKPIAAQIWIVSGTKAYIYKLAHLEEYSALSIGTILLDRIMQYTHETFDLCEIDFLTGDDPYKKLWMNKRREIWGIVFFNQKTLLGVLIGWLNIYGRLIKRKLSKVAFLKEYR